MHPTEVFPRLPDLVGGDAALVRRGRHVALAFMVHAGAEAFRIVIDGGRVAAVERGRFLLRSSAFSIRAEPETWRRFWQPVPEPGWHDLFALSKAGRAQIEGDLKPFMANLQYFKDVLAAPRRLHGGGAYGG